MRFSNSKVNRCWGHIDASNRDRHNSCCNGDQRGIRFPPILSGRSNGRSAIGNSRDKPRRVNGGHSVVAAAPRNHLVGCIGRGQSSRQVNSVTGRHSRSRRRRYGYPRHCNGRRGDRDGQTFRIATLGICRLNVKSIRPRSERGSCDFNVCCIA